MSTRTLMLTPWLAPYRVIPWERAVVLLYLGKVEVLEEYDVAIRAPSLSLRTPAVVRLRRGNVSTKQKLRFSRLNVFLRDGFRCQYCGERKRMTELNYDHVVPRMQGGKTVWENIVTCCYPCNDKKRSRTPEQASMKLLTRPVKPRTLPMTPIIVDTKTMPSAWTGYCASPSAA